MKIPYIKDFFDLTIGPDYVPGWVIWEAVREFIQNGLDGEKDGYPLTINRGLNGTVVISNKGALLKPEHLILGKTNKRNDDEYLGLNGEGFKLAMLALCRLAKEAGRDTACVIHTGSETWTPVIHFSTRYNTEIIRVNVSTRVDDGYLRAEIPGVSLTEWTKIQQRVLRFSAYDKIVTPVGELLTSSEQSNKLYCKGLWVSDLPNPSKFGYNLTKVKLDRDRKLADDYSLKTNISDVIQSLCLKDEISDETVLELLSDPKCIECTSLAYYGCGYGLDEFKAKIGRAWKRIHGERSVPVVSPEEAATCASIGRQGVTVSRILKDFMGEYVDSFANIKLEAELGVKKVYLDSELDERERHIISICNGLGKEATKHAYSLSIVDFNMPHIVGMRQGSIIKISKKLCCDAIAFLDTLIHEIAHLPGHKDLEKGHIDEATHIAARMIYISRKDLT